MGEEEEDVQKMKDIYKNHRFFCFKNDETRNVNTRQSITSEVERSLALTIWIRSTFFVLVVQPCRVAGW